MNDAPTVVGGEAYETISHAASRLNRSDWTIRQWVARGLLPAHRLGPRSLLVKSADVDAMLRPVTSAKDAR